MGGVRAWGWWFVGGGACQCPHGDAKERRGAEPTAARAAYRRPLSPPPPVPPTPPPNDAAAGKDPIRSLVRSKGMLPAAPRPMMADLRLTTWVLGPSSLKGGGRGAEGGGRRAGTCVWWWGGGVTQQYVAQYGLSQYITDVNSFSKEINGLSPDPTTLPALLTLHAASTSCRPTSRAPQTLATTCKTPLWPPLFRCASVRPPARPPARLGVVAWVFARGGGCRHSSAAVLGVTSRRPPHPPTASAPTPRAVQ